MKRLLLILSLLAMPFLATAQEESQADFLRRYNNLVERVGPAGLGVETLLAKWEAAYPEDPQQMLARFSFTFTRCRTSEVQDLPDSRHLGQQPILSMTDSLGKRHNYFEIYHYDDALFAEALTAIEKAIRAKPWRLDYRMVKTDALLAYEQGSPEMTVADLKALADKHYKEHPVWEYEGMDGVTDDQFKAFLQDYCAAIFRLGTDASALAFKDLSEYLLAYSKDDPVFLDNLGSYYLVKKDYKNARKYFDQVLRKHPSDMTALRNCILMARTAKDRKMETKYLALMARYGDTETERQSAQTRLDAYKKK